MKIKAESISKRYAYSKVWEALSFEIESPQTLVILGGNGSGKSTLARALIGLESVSKGKLSFEQHSKICTSDSVRLQSYIVAPAVLLPPVLKVEEVFETLAQFKVWEPNWNTQKALEVSQLQSHAHKQIDHLSSGMHQRLALTLSFAFQHTIRVYDEPFMNLDAYFQSWALELLQTSISNQTGITIIASNDPTEYNWLAQNSTIQIQL